MTIVGLLILSRDRITTVVILSHAKITVPVTIFLRFNIMNLETKKVEHLIAPQADIATTKALRYMARTKQRRTYLPYIFPAVAGTHLPTLRGWRVE